MDFKTINAHDLFERSLSAFRDSLAGSRQDELQQFASADAMLNDLKLHLYSAKGGRLERVCKKIEAFSQKLNAYFDVVGAFVQTNPEYAGWFWGCVLLVCKLGCNYTGFFERAADMFEQISAALPQYHDYVQLCRARNLPNERLAKSLSVVYADIIDFCHQMYTMLSGRRTGSWKERVAFVGRILWSSFDDRFAQLLNRMKRHEAIFRQEMSLHDSKMMNVVQSRLDIYYDALQATLSKSFTKVDVVSDVVAAELLAKSKERQLSTLKEWMGVSDYRTIYENARRKRREMSGEWFLSLDQYMLWRDAPFDNGALRAGVPRFQFVQAKPGYGKTFLSSTIIEDLQERSSFHVEENAKMPITAFFHFNRTSNVMNSCESSACLRAVATQVISSLHDDTWVLDSLAVLKGSKETGQLEASFDDVLNALKLVIRARPVYVVVDGIDECTDHDTLLTSLFQLSNNSDCRLLLLSRPDLPLPRDYLKSSMFLTLSTENNFKDILGLMNSEFKMLVEEGYFGNRAIPEDTAILAARQANGIFLWAQLFVSWLSNPALTPKNRHTFLADTQKFDGLDGLVIAILHRLDQASQHAKEMAAKIFSWVGAAFYPLASEALHVALAITPGEETTDLDYLVDFPACIPRLTGALVEIDPFGRPAFIHLSVRELLTSPRCQVPDCFSLANATAIHGRLASACLSHLTHDLPQKPIRKLQEDIRPKLAEGKEKSKPDLQESTHVQQGYNLNKAEVSIRHVPFQPTQAVCEVLHTHLINQTLPKEASLRFKRRRDHSSRLSIPAQQGPLPQLTDPGLPVSADLWGREYTSTITKPISRSYVDNDAEMLQADRIHKYLDSLPPVERVRSRFTTPPRPEVPEQPSTPAAPPSDEPPPKRHKAVQDEGSKKKPRQCVDSKFPLLRYATLCWVQHIYASFHPRYRNLKSQEPLMLAKYHEMRAQQRTLCPENSLPKSPAWAPFLSRFLFCRPSVTNWTESSFHYRWTPSLQKIMSPIHELSSEVSQDTSENRELHWIFMGLGQLAAALDDLAQKYRARLLDNPTLIWQRDITSATDPAFWPVWAEEKLADAEGWPSGCWTGESFVPGQTLKDLASFQDDFSRARS